jgi:hypothetical protein
MGIGSKFDVGKQVLGSINQTQADSGKKSGPAAPDYMGLAKQQGEEARALNTQQTWANRADQTNPYGSTKWGSEKVIDPATGQEVTKWTQTTDIAPELKGAYDSQLGVQTGRSELAQSMMGRLGGELGQAPDYSQLTPWGQQMQAGNLQATTNPYSFGDPRSQSPALQNSLNYSNLQNVDNSGASRQRAEDAIYKSATSRLDPQWAAQQSQLETQLANQGITRNSAAYQNAMNALQTQKTDAYQQAQMGAVTGAGAEAQRNSAIDMSLRQQQAAEAGNQGQFGNAAQQAAYQQALQSGTFGLSQQQQAFGQQQQAGSQNFSQQLQAGQYQNQQRQQQLAEMLQQRGLTLNEINSLMSGQQVQNPNFAAYNQQQGVAPTDYTGAAKNQYGAQMDQYNAQQAQSGQTVGALASLGAMFFSDARVKRDIRRIGRHARGFGIYRYRYVGERGSRVGVIAQEVRRYAPELVDNVRGVLRVNYAAL